MAFKPLDVPVQIPMPVADFVTGPLSEALKEFRFLLQQNFPDQAPQGSLQYSLAILILSITDGAAQTLYPASGSSSARFKGFIRSYYPWELDPPDGLTPEQATTELYYTFRCPLIHRFGMRVRYPVNVKLGRVFSQDENSVDALEAYTLRPYSDASIQKSDQRIVLWIDSYYWALRKTIERALADIPRMRLAEEWLRRGFFAEGRVSRSKWSQ